jgi:hypothetical protein
MTSSGLHPNQRKNWFRKGVSGNPRGRPAIGAALREWLYVLGDENEDGTAKYDEDELRAIMADKQAAPMKRTAAARLVEMYGEGRQGREACDMILDRLEGKPAQAVHVTGAMATDPALEVTQETLARIRDAASEKPLLEGGDGE